MRRWILALTGVSLLAGASLAAAHSGDGMKTSPGDCDQKNDRTRKECLECVTKSPPHHYHPDAAPEKRCHKTEESE
jgi:hypothetical protein